MTGSPPANDENCHSQACELIVCGLFSTICRPCGTCPVPVSSTGQDLIREQGSILLRRMDSSAWGGRGNDKREADRLSEYGSYIFLLKGQLLYLIPTMIEQNQECSGAIENIRAWVVQYSRSLSWRERHRPDQWACLYAKTEHHFKSSTYWYPHSKGTRTRPTKGW